MVRKDYNWASGAKLEEHSRRKLKILREYFSEYLAVRCKLPQQERFRIAVVDGFLAVAVMHAAQWGRPSSSSKNCGNSLKK